VNDQVKRPVGRPPKITKAWANKNSEGLAERFKLGESLAEVCLELGICKESYYKAMELSKKFHDQAKLGLLYSEAWWTKLGRAGAAGKADIQPATWIFNMKNRFKWTEKSEISGPDGGPVQTEDVNDLSKEDLETELKKYGIGVEQKDP
jgi:hypothetical protein